MSALRHLRLVGSLLILLSMTACAQFDGMQLASEENEGGIIGTGIVGTITDIGSIYVNGIRVTYDDSLQVETAFGMESPRHLAPGDTVSIEALVDDGVFRATSIERYQPIIAPIEAMATDRSWIQALGVRVTLDQTTRVAVVEGTREIDRQDLQLGAWIAVSGLWRDDEVVASGIKWIARQPVASVRGVLNNTIRGALRIGGVRVKNMEQSRIEIGRIAAAQGILERPGGKTRLAVRRFAIKRFSPQIRRLLVEGFASRPTRNGAYTIYGSGLTSFAADSDEPMSTKRSLFCGTLNGTFDIERSIPLPKNPGQGLRDFGC